VKQGLTDRTPEADNAREKSRKAMSQLADDMTAFLKLLSRPGWFVVEVHHDGDEIKIIKTTHQEKLPTKTL